MADLTGFDASTVEPSTDFEAIPAGKYLAVITASEKKATKSGTGQYLELTFQVIEGTFKNRLLWARLNLENANPLAVQIARAQLSAICRSVGVMAPTDSHQLHDLPLTLTVQCKKRDDTGETVNEIRGFSKKEAADPGNAEPLQATDNSPPWART